MVSKEHIPYHLVSPNMAGQGVKKMQTALKKNGRLLDEVDGVFGIHTGQAVKREKFWLGYADKSVDESAGELFLSYLYGTKKPTKLMEKRAKDRRVADAKKKAANGTLTLGQVVLKTACGQIGQTEHPPDSNRSKFNTWYGIVGAWCAMFVSWCWAPHSKNFKAGIFAAYVPYVVAAARLGQHGLSLTRMPVTGNPVCFDWNGDGTADHIGIYAEEKDLRRFAPVEFQKALNEFGSIHFGEFWTVEGNTGVGNDSNGGVVMIRKRNHSQVQAFVKVSA